MDNAVSPERVPVCLQVEPVPSSAALAPRLSYAQMAQRGKERVAAAAAADPPPAPPASPPPTTATTATTDSPHETPAPSRFAGRGRPCAKESREWERPRTRLPFRERRWDNREPEVQRKWRAGSGDVVGDDASSMVAVRRRPVVAGFEPTADRRRWPAGHRRSAERSDSRCVHQGAPVVGRRIAFGDQRARRDAGSSIREMIDGGTLQ